MVRVHPESVFEICPRGAARSARHPVTVEIVGSNPIEDAVTSRAERRESRARTKAGIDPLIWLSTLHSGLIGTVRKRQSGEAQTFVSLRVQLPPVPVKSRSSRERLAFAEHA